MSKRAAEILCERCGQVTVNGLHICVSNEAEAKAEAEHMRRKMRAVEDQGYKRRQRERQQRSGEKAMICHICKTRNATVDGETCAECWREVEAKNIKVSAGRTETIGTVRPGPDGKPDWSTFTQAEPPRCCKCNCVPVQFAGMICAFCKISDMPRYQRDFVNMASAYRPRDRDDRPMGKYGRQIKVEVIHSRPLKNGV